MHLFRKSINIQKKNLALIKNILFDDNLNLIKKLMFWPQESDGEYVNSVY